MALFISGVESTVHFAPDEFITLYPGNEGQELGLENS